jgi:hypothetical protein
MRWNKMVYDHEREERWERWLSIRYFVLVLSFVVCFTASPAVEGGMIEIRATYERAVEQRGRAVTEALDAVEVFLQNNPSDVVATMYRGSLYAMLAGDSFFPWKKIYYLHKGVDLMDSAMERLAYANPHGRDPELEMLLVRGVTNARIPRVFNRSGMARRDLSRIHEHWGFPRLPEKVRAEVLAWIARYAREDGETDRAENAMAEARNLNATVADAVWGGK